jgi:hypothetical protein
MDLHGDHRCRGWAGRTLARAAGRIKHGPAAREDIRRRGCVSSRSRKERGMIRLLQLIFIGHFHKWKTIDERFLNIMDGKNVASTGTRYIQQCESCGKVIKRDLA